MSDLTIIIPTRNRPTNAEATLTACEATCTTNPTIVLAVDLDDPHLAAYTDLAADRASLHMIEPPGSHVRAINEAATFALEHPVTPYAFIKLDDDHRPRTSGWDATYLAALRKLGTGIVYGDDLLQGKNMPTAPGITADIVTALGFMAPPQLAHLFCDNFWRDLATEAGCLAYLPDVIVEHAHPGAGKATWDDNYARVNSPHRYATDGAAYQDYRNTRMAADARTIADLRTPSRTP